MSVFEILVYEVFLLKNQNFRGVAATTGALILEL